MKVRLVTRYIRPTEDMSYLHQKSRRSIGYLLLSAFLFIHAILQSTLNYTAIAEIVFATWLLGRSNSYVMALLLALGSVGILTQEMDTTRYYMSLGLFAMTLFIGTVLIIGGIRRKVHYPVGMVVGTAFGSDGGCEGSGEDGGGE